MIDKGAGRADASQSTDTLRQAISSGNIQTSIKIASKLHSRHGPFATCSVIWWNNIVQASQIPSTEDTSAVINAILAHVEQVDEKKDGSLDFVVSRWLDDLNQTQIAEILGARTAHILCTVILNLASHRRLHIVPKLLAKLVYPTWLSTTAQCLRSKARLTKRHLRLLESTIILAQHFLLDSPPNTSLPPTNLRQAMVLQTERGGALNAVNVPSLIRHLPYLVVLSTAFGSSESLRSQVSTLLGGLAMTPPFKAAAFRHLNVLKDSFLSNEWSKPPLEPAVAGEMVDALRLIMSQGANGMLFSHLMDDADSETGTQDLSSIASLESTSLFSAWRYTSIVLGIRVEIKDLARRIENGEDAAEARQTLCNLVHSTLDREATADDTDLLCEAFRGVEAVAAQEVCEGLEI